MSVITVLQNSQTSPHQPVKVDKQDQSILLLPYQCDYLYLLPPQYLLNAYEFSSPVKSQLKLTLQQLKGILNVENPAQAMASLHTVWQQISPVEIDMLEENFTTGTSLEPQQIREFDRYTKICRVKTKEPAKLIIASVLQTYYFVLATNQSWFLDITEKKHLEDGFLCYIDLLGRSFNLPTIKGIKTRESQNLMTSNWGSEDMKAIEFWRKSHWVFIVFCQALILCLKHFVDSYESGRLDRAKIELQAAAKLMWASGAAMKLAGSFSRQVYETEVRPTMSPGHPQSLVESESLSGLMIWEHNYLVHIIWKQRLSPILKTLPTLLQTEHAEFVRAYQQGLSGGHKSVCTKFGGSEVNSLTSPNLYVNNAVENLEKFEQGRLKLLDPQKAASGKCPFHQMLKKISG